MGYKVIFVLSALLTQLRLIASLIIEAKYPSMKLGMKSLYLRGSGCGLSWDKGVKMEKIEGGSWIYDLTGCSVTEKSLEIKALIDDSTWMIGSNHHIDLLTTITNDLFYPWFETKQGSLTMFKNVYSSELENTRDVKIYLPPSYLENTLKTHTNVLVMHDGQNLFDPKTSAFGTAWMCQDTLDELIVEGLSDEVIIIGAYNTANRTDEYTYIYDPSEEAGGKGDLYLDWIESTLLPLVQSELRVDLRRDSLGIMGSSLGGLISCYAGWTRPEIYGKVGCMSSSFWWDENNFQNEIITSSVPDDPSLPLIYMDSGTGSVGEIHCTEYTTQINKYSQQIGYVENVTMLQYVDQGAVHDEASWGARFDIPMTFLYPSYVV
jgi:predicted alpha/beta superfamily hydrolase